MSDKVIEGYLNPDGSGKGNWAADVTPPPGPRTLAGLANRPTEAAAYGERDGLREALEWMLTVTEPGPPEALRWSQKQWAAHWDLLHAAREQARAALATPTAGSPALDVERLARALCEAYHGPGQFGLDTYASEIHREAAAKIAAAYAAQREDSE